MSASTGNSSGSSNGGGWRSSPFLAPTPKLRVGWAVSTTFGVMRRNAATLAPLGLLLVGLPVAVVDMADLPALLGRWAGVRNPAVTAFLGTLPVSAFQALLTACVTFVAVADLSGQRIGLGASLAPLPRLALPAVAVGLLSVLGVLAAAVLLVVPGLVLAVTWLAALPALAAEGPGIRRAFGRSAALVQGNFWRCAALFLLYLLTAVAVAALGSFASPSPDNPAEGGPVGIGIDAATQAAAGILMSVGSAVAYVGLRRIKDGDEPEQISAVFG